MKLFSTKQIAEIDKYTIKNEPISEIDLMERASLQITNWFVYHFSTEHLMVFFAGPGNNGGDAMAIARQLSELGYMSEVYLLDFGKNLKKSPSINWKRLKEQRGVSLKRISQISDFPEINENDIFIDGLFGSGLTRPLNGVAADVVKKINSYNNITVSVDMPSGLMGEDNSKNIYENIIRADFTLTFQFPKISFLLPDNNKYVGSYQILPISLHPDAIEKTSSTFFYTEKKDIKRMLHKRSKFSHKGDFGHSLLIAGSYGKIGASVLASRACLRAGAGLLTVHVPKCGYNVIQSTVPEAMVDVDVHDSIFTGIDDFFSYSAIAVGPGIGTKNNTKKALHNLIANTKVPMVIDADALNILAENKKWLKELPMYSILTPHPGEFKRLTGKNLSSWESIVEQKKMACELNLVIVLKGANTSIALPNGDVFFNSTGNPGMATAGSGDSLTGIILGLLSQNLFPEDAALLGVYIHGLAGDIAAENFSEVSLIAHDITDNLGKAFKKVIEK